MEEKTHLLKKSVFFRVAKYCSTVMLNSKSIKDSIVENKEPIKHKSSFFTALKA